MHGPIRIKAFLFIDPWFPKEHCFLKVPTLRPFVLLLGATCRWRWICSTNGIILIRESRNVRRKPCPRANFSTTALALTGLGSNPGLSGERQATDRLNHSTTRKTKINLYSILGCSPYHTVNTHRLGYKNQSGNVVQGNNHCLFSDPY